MLSSWDKPLCPWVSLSWTIIKTWDSKADPLQYLLSTNKELIVQCFENSPEWKCDGIGTPDWRLSRVIFLIKFKPNVLDISSPKTYTGTSLAFSSIRALLCHGCLVAQSCLTLCDPVDCSVPGFPVLHHLLEFAPTHIHQVGDAAQPSRPLWPSALPALNRSQPSGSFPMSWLFASGGQSIGALALASVIPMNIQTLLCTIFHKHRLS